MFAVAAMPVAAAPLGTGGSGKIDTLTAANGSNVFLRVDENACEDGPGGFYCIGSYTATGATGRFTGATGTGKFDGQVNYHPNSCGTFQATDFGQIG